MTARRLATAAGVVALAAAIAPPTHRAVETSAAMHMVQHLVLILIVAPLFAYGGAAPIVGVLPRPFGRRLGRTIARLPGRQLVQMIIRAPLVAWLGHAVVLWFWHLPLLYDAAVHDHRIHAVEHATLVGSAVLFWSALLRPAPRAGLGFGGGILYTFGASIQSSVLGALLAFAEQPWYASHGHSRFDVDVALADQHLAGVLMWVPGGCGYLVAMLAWLWGWLAESRRRTAILIAMVALIVGAHAGCRREPPTTSRVEGDAARGATAIARHGCGACHRIPGIDGARGAVGPSLAGVASRTFLVGALTNDPGNLARWIRDPQAIAPGTVMPRLGVSESEASDIAAYLYRLR